MLKLYVRWNLQIDKYDLAVIFISEVTIFMWFWLSWDKESAIYLYLRNENCSPPVKVACRTYNWSGSVSWCSIGWCDATWIALRTLHVPLVELHHVIVAYSWQLQAQGKASYWTVCCAHRCALMWATRWCTVMDGSINWTLCSVRNDLFHTYW